MEFFRKTLFPILVTGIWINLSEGIRWELLIKEYWIENYNSLNLTFPDGLENNLVWLLWGFLVAGSVFILSHRFNLWETAFISWFMVFVLEWVMLSNLAIMPSGILWYVVPWSFGELLLGSLICKAFVSKEKSD